MIAKTPAATSRPCPHLKGRHILLGVSGGIAAYKSVELVRRLRELGADIRVVMTQAAGQFITVLTMQAVSNQRVYTALLDPDAESTMSHIELARWADVILVAPATAHFLAKLSHGLADDLLSTLCLASNAPVVVAPAMNRQMWLAEATQNNARVLHARGVRLWGPDEGYQACGEIGPGRMLEPAELSDRVCGLFAHPLLQGLRAVITAGPTREDIDPVRYLSNRSSGRMGYALARAAREMGAEVTLVSGPVALSPPPGVQVVSVYSAEDMLQAVLKEMEQCHIFIANAAVADYRPVKKNQQKLKKHQATLTLELERTPDILTRVASLAKPPFTVGFAAETECLEHYAKDKLKHKKLDMVAANPVNVPGLGFDSEDNTLHVFWADGDKQLAPASKDLLARQLLQQVAECYKKTRRKV